MIVGRTRGPFMRTTRTRTRADFPRFSRRPRSRRLPLVPAVTAAALLGIAVTACQSRAPDAVNKGGAKVLRAQARAEAIEGARVLRLDPREEAFRLSEEELETLREVISRGQPSDNLHVLPPPWNVVLEIETSSGERFVAHPLDSGLRVNEEKPYSSTTVDPHGEIGTPSIADLWLETEDAARLYDLLEKHLGEPESKTTRERPDPEEDFPHDDS
jgi:hypothetical protein